MLPEPVLLQLQRRVLGALREPIFGESRALSELPPRAGSVSPEFVATAEALIAPSPALTAIERLELYHRQYWYRLLDSLAEDFSALRDLLGEPRFWGLLEAYLEAVPSTSFTLRHLGRGLPGFLAARPELVPEPVHAEELARIEDALCAGFEAGALPPLEGAALARARVRLQPHLRLLALRTSADLLWRRAEDGASRSDARSGRPLPHPGASRRPRGRLGPASARPRRFVAVWRDGLELRVERLPRAAFALLAALEETGSLEAAMGEVARARLLSRSGDPARVAAWFRAWINRGWLCEAQGPLATERSSS